MPQLDPDDRMFVSELEERGIRTQTLVWDDASIDWKNAGLCLIRSTWDYHLKTKEYFAWLKHVESVTEIHNNSKLVLWNAHKFYLRYLEEKGISIVPTEFCPSGETLDLHKLMKSKGWTEAVIKPAIGLATYGIKKACLGDKNFAEAQSHLDKLLQGGDVLIQPFLKSVEEYGERDLVFIDGNFSHAVRKSPFQILAAAGEAGETAITANVEEIELAYKTIATLPEKPLYARVDIVRDQNNKPVIIELELVEPSLFFAFDKDAAKKFADVVCTRL